MRYRLLTQRRRTLRDQCGGGLGCVAGQIRFLEVRVERLKALLVCDNVGAARLLNRWAQDVVVALVSNVGLRVDAATAEVFLAEVLVLDDRLMSLIVWVVSPGEYWRSLWKVVSLQ